MISIDQIRQLAVKNQTTELNVRREYVQHLFLSYLYHQENARHIYFKGGTALRFIYKSPRFSEDLDFSSSSTNIRFIEDVVTTSLVEVEREGISTDIIESKKTSGGYLAIIKFKLFDMSINIQLEISFRDNKATGEVITIVNDFIPVYTLVALIEEQLISQKIQALITRQAPRDYYDLYFILRANLLPPQKRNMLKNILDKLNRANIEFVKELEQFLPKTHWDIVKNFKIILEKESRNHI